MNDAFQFIAPAFDISGIMNKKEREATYLRQQQPVMSVGRKNYLTTILFFIALGTATGQHTAGYSYRILDAAGHTYGYEILRNGKVFIRQVNRPGLPGLAGFQQKKSARQVAALVIRKLQQGETLPTVSPKELDSLHVH